MSDPNDVPCQTFQMVRAPQCTHCGDYPGTTRPATDTGCHGYLEGCGCPECSARYREEFPDLFQD